MILAKVALIALAASALAQPAQAQFPREGVADIPNGVAGPFVGRWSVGISSVGLIAGDTINIPCTDPAVISAVDEVTITYSAPGGETLQMELTAFSGRTTWFPERGETRITVWTSEDTFYLYETRTGRARWDHPYVYRRCPPPNQQR